MKLPLEAFKKLLENVAKQINSFEEERHFEADPNRTIDCSIRVRGTFGKEDSLWFVWDGEKFSSDKSAESEGGTQ